jgi:hypothetical protein
MGTDRFAGSVTIVSGCAGGAGAPAIRGLEQLTVEMVAAKKNTEKPNRLRLPTIRLPTDACKDMNKPL